MAEEVVTPEKFDIQVARFPYHRLEDPDVGDWLAESVHYLKTHPRIGRVLRYTKNDTPIPMLRNEAAWTAKWAGCRYLLMIDSDMKPDLPGQEKFLPTALEFLLHHDGPAVIAAPYCGPRPHCNVFVFRWAGLSNDEPNPHARLEQYSREEAELWRGIDQVAAIGTGLILIDVRALDVLEPDEPFFYYEYTDGRQIEKASTEDVTFTRDLCLLGVPIYCAWDCWAGHHKDDVVTKPVAIKVDDLRESFVRAIKNGHKRSEKLLRVLLEDGKVVVRGNEPAKAPAIFGREGARPVAPVP